MEMPRGKLKLDVAIPGAQHLMDAEAYSRELANYSWFACKYPDFACTKGLPEMREKLTDFIDKCLLGNQRAFRVKRQRQYNWKDGDFDSR
jgi:hypothetical protein